ncbi:hypothetical protein M758_4G085200 [Ceratodon purpureus]|uniref:Uncharacterized protein n=1 Tax=Ceratodon purpureus TaxID=3225 RepID=A0A8T0I8E8_CERPU|nr:hypothetical protein KC19_4G084300 [Ceratodon purpureus]KAG0618689.1 hypothetical protein M758_4G085200 [Ceratodon purpureus]
MQLCSVDGVEDLTVQVHGWRLNTAMQLSFTKLRIFITDSSLLGINEGDCRRSSRSVCTQFLRISVLKAYSEKLVNTVPAPHLRMLCRF